MAFPGVKITTLRNGANPVTGYRQDLAAGDTLVASLTSTRGVSTFNWQLLGRPEGSSAGGAGPEPIALGSSSTASFTVDDDTPYRRDGSYLLQCTLNAGTPTETRIRVLLVRLSGLVLPGNRALRKLSGFEADDDDSIPNTDQGWATELNRWLEFLRNASISPSGGANPLLTYITKGNETTGLPNSIGLSTLGGPGLLKFAADGTPSKATAGTDYQLPMSAADGTIVFATATTIRVGSVPASSVTGLFYQQAANAGTPLTQRGTLNVAAPLLLADNSGASRTDLTLTIDGTLAVSGGALGRAAITGDVLVSAGANTSALGAHVVTGAKFRQSAGLSVVGNSTNATADVVDITATATGQVLQDLGTTIGWAALDYSHLTGTPAAPTGTGLATVSGGTFGAARTLTSPSGTIVVTNGDGSAGNPAVDLPYVITPQTFGGYGVASLTVDGYGRVTAATAARFMTTIAGVMAGGDLDGSYPYPLIAQKGATAGQVLTWDGLRWNPASPVSAGITQLTGDVVAGPGAGSVSATIQPHVVSYAKMQQASASVLLGNATGATANVAEIPLGTGLAFSAGSLVNASPLSALTATLPLVMTTGTNVAVEGAVTTGGTSTAPTSLGALSSGMLFITVAGSVATPGTFAAGTARVPFGSGSNGALTDSPTLLYQSSQLQILNTSSGSTGIGITNSSNGVSAESLLRFNNDTTHASIEFFSSTTTISGALPSGLSVTGSGGGVVVTDAVKGVAFGTAAKAVTDTGGYLQLQTVPGVPNGAQTPIAGQAPVVVDSVDNRLYAYNGGWKLFGQFTGGLSTGILKNTTSTGVWTIAAAGTDYQAPGNYITALTGDVTAAGPGSAAATIQPHAVTYAKIQQASAATLLGNPAASTGNVSEITIGSGLALSVGGVLSATGGGGTVSGVTATAPLFSSGGVTPNLTIQGAITTGGVSTSATSLGALASGTLQHSVSSGVSSPSAFAGTTGSIPFYTAGAQLAQDNGHLFWDSTNIRLGVGVGAPAVATHVKGTSTANAKLYVENTANGASDFVEIGLVNSLGTGSRASIFYTADANTSAFGQDQLVFQNTLGGIQLLTGSSTSFALKVTNTGGGVGNVLVAALGAGGLVKALSSTGQLAIAASSDITAAVTWPGGVLEGSSGALTSLSVAAGAIPFGSGTGGGLAQDSTHLFWDNASARLGVGTSSPAVLTHVKGTTTASAKLYVENTAAGTADFTEIGLINNLGAASRASIFYTADTNTSAFGQDQLVLQNSTGGIQFVTGSSTTYGLKVTNNGAAVGGVFVPSLAGVSDAMVYATATNGQLSRVALGAGLTFSGGTLSATGGGASFYQFVALNSAIQTQRGTLNFVTNNFAIADNPGSGSTDVQLANGIGINGATVPTNAALVVGHTTNSNRDRVQFFVGGGSTFDSPDNTLFAINPTSSTVPNGTYKLATLRIQQATWAAPSTSPTVTDASSLYIDGPPNLSGNIFVTPYPLHVASGQVRFDGGLRVTSLVGPGTTIVDSFGQFSVASVPATTLVYNYDGWTPRNAGITNVPLAAGSVGFGTTESLGSGAGPVAVTAGGFSYFEYALKTRASTVRVVANIQANSLTPSGTDNITWILTRNGGASVASISMTYGAGAQVIDSGLISVSSPAVSDTWGLIVTSTPDTIGGSIVGTVTVLIYP